MNETNGRPSFLYPTAYLASMTALRVPVLAVLLVVTTLVVAGAAVGVAAQETETPSEEASMPLGASISGFMQASAGQAGGAVENGMWEAAFENASEESAQRALVERRVGALDGTLAELRQQRTELRERFQAGEIGPTEYRAGLAAIVGRLAAVGDGIETTSDRADAVGVDATRLAELRSQARELGGQEVAEMARNLSGGTPPGRAGVFGDGPRGQGGDGKGSGTGGGPPADAGKAGDRGKPTPTPDGAG